MKVLKFGGTSVGTPERMRDVADLVKDCEAIIVLSAIAKTTDKLLEISRLLISQKRDLAGKRIEALQAEYHTFVESFFSTDSYRAKGNELIDSHFEHIRSFTLDMFTSHEQHTILAQGELISSTLLHFYLEECGVKSVLLPALPVSWYSRPAPGCQIFEQAQYWKGGGFWRQNRPTPQLHRKRGV